MVLPYGAPDLRPIRRMTEDTVACHVAGCATVVPRQRGRFSADRAFLCEQHGIYVSPATFQYADCWRNLLWREQSDRALFGQIAEVKRTTERLGRERDEDALAWNVARAFDRGCRLRRLTEILLPEPGDHFPCGEPQLVYWSADGRGGRWAPLERAQEEFGEAHDRGTEPDLALWWQDRHLVFVEAKFCSGSRTRPSAKPHGEDPRPKAYGQHPHFPVVFSAGYHEIAVENQLYQLMRLWLLGSWIAQQQAARFSLVNLVRWDDEKDVEQRFGLRFCSQTAGRRFSRATWESIWDALPSSGLDEEIVCALQGYLGNKTCGYDGSGRLQRAFRPPEERHLG